MKNLPKILLIVLSVLGIIGLMWVIFDYDSEVDQNVLIAKPSTAYMIWVSLISTVITISLFLYYKVMDVIVHPSHLREQLIVIGIVLVAVVLGFIFGGSEEVINIDGDILGGFKSRLIGSGLVASIILLIVSTGFLAFDAVKATLK